MKLLKWIKKWWNYHYTRYKLKKGHTLTTYFKVSLEYAKMDAQVIQGAIQKAIKDAEKYDLPLEIFVNIRQENDDSIRGLKTIIIRQWYENIYKRTTN